MDYLLFFPALVVFFAGLVIGSFLNVVIFRLNTENGIILGRSKCLSCCHQLRWYDLFPVLSFLFLRGKCRYCKKKISWQYPLVELSAGIIAVAVFFQIFAGYDAVFYSFTFWDGVRFFLSAFIFFAMIVMFVFDLRHYIIPDEVVYPAIGAAFLLLFAAALSGGDAGLALFFSSLGGAALSGGFFLLLVLGTRGEGMGGGDVKLGLLMGLVLGIPKIFLALFIAFVSGAVVGIALLLSGKKKMKSALPFGPFLILGFMASYFYGAEIISWYFNKFIAM